MSFNMAQIEAISVCKRSEIKFAWLGRGLRCLSACLIHRVAKTTFCQNHWRRVSGML